MSYLRYMSLFTYCGVQHISVSPGVCRRIHVFVYVICVCLRIVVSNTYLYLQVFVGGFMSLFTLYVFVYVLCLFTLFVFVYVLWCPTHICISRCL